MALSDKTGSIRFYKRGEGSGVTFVKEGEEIQVNAITLPEFLTVHNVSNIDFINLDCEGSELLVFKSAQTVLEKHLPAIFCEVHRDFLKTLNQSVEDIVTFLRGIGYDVKPVHTEDLNIPSDFNQCSHIFAQKSLL